MIEFQAVYFDGRNSRPYPVKVVCHGEVLGILSDDKKISLYIPLSKSSIAPALGTSRRTIKLPDGAACETDDYQAVAALEKLSGINRGMRLVHFLESRWAVVMGCLACLVFCTIVFIKWGIPALAAKAAYAVPPGISRQLSEKTLEFLDSKLLEPTKLKAARADRLRRLLKDLSTGRNSSFDYRLELRAGRIGPNAFALPSGIIVITDQLVELAKDERELTAVLKHEMAHVEKRHGLWSVFQSTGLFLLVAALAGDVTSITSTAAILPTILAESGYSRQFEREADEEAGRYLIQKGWTTRPFQQILLSLSKKAPEYAGLSIISTHPPTSERVANLRRLEMAR